MKKTNVNKQKVEKVVEQNLEKDELVQLSNLTKEDIKTIKKQKRKRILVF